MLSSLVQQLPKAELHLHIEGSLEPELMLALAKKHKLALPYANLAEVKAAYNFDSLQSFLNLYYLGASVLVDEDDFFNLMWAYLLKCKEDNVVHAEIMFDPQTHTERGIGFNVFMPGFLRAIEKAEQDWGMSCFLIMSFLRHLDEQSAFTTLAQAQPYLANIKAVGLDSAEMGNPPEKFEGVFRQAKEQGLLRVAHAGEEGPPAYIWGALNNLDVQRIDHGVRSSEDNQLMQHLASNQIPLTVCPLSNIKLCVFDNMVEHNLLDLLDKGLMITINADDPSYFGGYLNDNYEAVLDALPVSKAQLATLVANSFKASFLSEDKKEYWLKQVANLSE